MRRAAGFVAIASALACAFLRPSPAVAYETASLSTHIPHPRYIVCRDEPEPRAARSAPIAKAGADELVPVPRLKSPGKLTVIPHLVDDAAFAEPIPDRVAAGSAAPSPAPPPALVGREGVNGIHCLGRERGRAAMLRVISAPPGTHFYGHPEPRYFIADNMIAASAFDAKEAIAPLRVWLDRPLPAALKTYEDGQRISMKGHAAMALAELGDVASAPKIRELVVALETLRIGSTWRDTFQALRSLDRPTAAAYSADLVVRMAEGRAPKPSGRDLEEVLETIDPNDAPRVRPALVKLGTEGHDGCLAVGARLRLGDEALAKVLRPDLEGSISTNLGATCWSQVIEAMAPGKSMTELSVLLLRGRWERVADLALVLRARGEAGAKERATFASKVRAQTTRPTQGFRDHDSVYRLGALAAVGDESALRELYSIVDAPSDDTDTPWVAAVYALRAALPEAHAHAQRLLEAGIRRHLVHGEIEALTSGVAVSWPVKLVRELARQKSPLAALGLLQSDVHAREAAMFAVSRTKVQGMCDLLGNGARLVDPREYEVVESAFWAATALGAQCRPVMERLAADRGAPGFVRGMAIEELAMIRASSASSMASAWAAEGRRSSAEEASLHRVRIIMSSPE